MGFKANKNVIILSLAFLFIFLGFGSVQQYVTVFFSDMGKANVGFWSLILIYGFFGLFNPMAATFIPKYGAKVSMIVGSIFYSLYIFALLNKSILIVYVSSALLGIGASLLWMGQNSYIIRMSDRKDYGKNSGMFFNLNSIGPVIGVILLGYLIKEYSFNIPFLVYAILSLIGFFLLFKLKKLKDYKSENKFKLIKKAIKSKLLLSFSTIWIVVNLLFALSIGMIPIEIKNRLGIEYIGLLASAVFLIPVIFSYFFGNLSDKIGRKPMIVSIYIITLLTLILLYVNKSNLVLIFGAILLSLGHSVTRIINSPLIGDLSNKKNLESLAALFWVVQDLSIVIFLMLNSFIKTNLIYLIFIAILVICLLIILPLFKYSLEELRLKISKEIK